MESVQPLTQYGVRSLDGNDTAKALLGKLGFPPAKDVATLNGQIDLFYDKVTAVLFMNANDPITTDHQLQYLFAQGLDVASFPTSQKHKGDLCKCAAEIGGNPKGTEILEQARLTSLKG